jgi:hypothetical protein
MILKPYHNKDITIFAETNFRDQRKKFGIKQGDRRKHMYIVGKTGMGKTSMLQHMIVQDIKAGQGVCVLDPNGALIKQILHYIPPSRARDVIYFNPTDLNYPIAFNLLDGLKTQDLIGPLISVFETLWKDVWGPRLEYVFKNTLLTLAIDEKNTILHLLPFFTDKSFRHNLLNRLDDPVLVDFWQNEYQNNPERFRYQAIEPLRDKIGQIISNPLVRNIIGQNKTSFSFKEILEHKKIVLITLNKNEVGQDTVKLLGSCFILKLFLQAKAAKSVDNLPPDSNFYLYIDEFQNFSIPQLLEMISTSNYGLNLILANQYLRQLSPDLIQAIFGNIGTIAAFRLSADDADILAHEFQPGIKSEDLIKLPKHNIILKLLIDNEISKPFTASSLPPLPVIGLMDKIIQYSRETYANQKQEVERLIVKSLRISKKTTKPLAKIKKKPKVQTSPNKINVFRKKLLQIKSQTPDKKDMGSEKNKQKKDNQKYKELKPGEEVLF